jgi:putative ABC transport system permease protein
MLIFKLAFRNIMGAGFRTWLNVFILSVAFVASIWMIGLLNGVYDQLERDTIDTELGGGQFRHHAYDPFNPLTLKDAHALVSPALDDLVSHGLATPILITSGAIFPHGRAQSVLIKGIPPEQDILSLPAQSLAQENPDITPALIGSGMAADAQLKIGDEVTLRWRDIHGTFDAADVFITHIMRTTNPGIDMGQIWLPLNDLQEMMQASGEATLIVLKKELKNTIPTGDDTWIHHSQDDLTAFIRKMYQGDAGGTLLMTGLILAAALLAIFDTQALAIFRRRREMGTLMALGMARRNVIALFTLEGSLHGALALMIGSIYGIPMLILTAAKGIPLPELGDMVGIAMATKMYPTYGAPLFVGSTLLVMVTVIIVSYLPTRRISKLKPTDALRGTLT